MKKRTKLLLGGIALASGLLVLSSCTKSFCSNVDQGRMLYAFDPGVTRYSYGGTETITVSEAVGGVTYTYTVNNVDLIYATWNNDAKEYQFADDDKLTYLNNIVASSISSGYLTVNGNTLDYYKAFDELVLENALKASLRANCENVTISSEEDFALFERELSYFSYVKFVKDNDSGMWESWTAIDKEVRAAIDDEDKCPSSDFSQLYHSKMSSYVATYRTCLTTKTDKYGSYGYSTEGVYIEEKTWAYAWTKGGFFEGLLVFPIGWLIDQIAFGFHGLGVANGWSALLSILFVTLIVRLIMMAATIKTTAGNAKMTELQPEITKIQNKYPNANTSQVEKQRMAEEMNRLYKKNKINPFASLIVMVFQFPIFICVWGALSGSAALSSGTVLGLDLSLTIREVLFNGANWGPAGGYAAVTALFLFLFMALAQAASMLLPQFIQKKKQKEATKLGKNPAQNEQQNRMKWVTYIMLAMIIFMGFSLVSAMGVYWFIGALISIGQTLITQSIISHKKKSKK